MRPAQLGRALLLGGCLAAPPMSAAGPDAATLLSAPLLPEGSPSDSPGTLALAGHDPVVLDLQQPRPVRALLLQADGNDVYWVEGSDDGQVWTTLWRVRAYGGQPGLRTRSTRLASPARPRFVRLRATAGDGRYSVARLRIEPEVPEAWPPPLVALEGRSLPPFPALSPQVVLALRHALGGLALLAAGLGLLRRTERPAVKRRRQVLLGLVAAASVFSWPNFGNFHYYGGRVHLHEAFHYFMGAKYLPEIGYTGLYGGAALAEREDGAGAEEDTRPVRDLLSNRPTTFARAAAGAAGLRTRFSPARWEEFRHDARWFRQRLGPRLWQEALNDHGFNAGPAWLLLARPLTQAGPLTRFHLEWLAVLDLLLILTVGGLVWRSFGYEAACLAAVYWGLNSFSRFAWTGGAILRLDWLCLSVAALCALRRGRPGLAGLAVGYAGLIRLFPFCLAGGVALQGLMAVAETRSLRPLKEQARFWVGLVLSVLLLGPLSSWIAGGWHAWPDFAANSQRFLGTEASNFLGLPVLAAYRHDLRQALAYDPLRPEPLEVWEQAQAVAAREARPALAAAALVFLVLLALAVRQRPPWVAAILGLGFAPIVQKLANYYFSWLLVYALLAELSPAAGFALTLVAWTSNLVADACPAYDERALWSSLLVCGLVVGLTARLARPSAVRGDAPGPGTLDPRA